MERNKFSNKNLLFDLDDHNENGLPHLKNYINIHSRKFKIIHYLNHLVRTFIHANRDLELKA